MIVKQEVETNDDEFSQQTEHTTEWENSLQSIKTADVEEKRMTDKAQMKRNAKSPHTGYIHHDEDYGSKLSEAAAVGWSKPHGTSQLAFNPFSGRGKLMAQLAKSKRTLKKS